MEIFLIILAAFLSLIGIAGSVLPALPGAPLNFAALILLYFIERGDNPSLWAMLIFGLLAAISLVADYALPARNARRFGATRLGMIGAVLGMLVGLGFFSLPGLFIGTFVGAILGELLAGKELAPAIRAGAAGVGGNLLAIIMKTLLALSMTAYFLLKLF